MKANSKFGWFWVTEHFLKLNISSGPSPHTMQADPHFIVVYYKENDSFTSCVKELFHSTTKRQTGYSRFAILISTILVTKHPFFLLKISLFLLPNALLSPPEFSAPPLLDLSS